MLHSQTPHHAQGKDSIRALQRITHAVLDNREQSTSTSFPMQLAKSIQRFSQQQSPVSVSRAQPPLRRIAVPGSPSPPATEHRTAEPRFIRAEILRMPQTGRAAPKQPFRCAALIAPGELGRAKHPQQHAQPRAAPPPSAAPGLLTLKTCILMIAGPASSRQPPSSRQTAPTAPRPTTALHRVAPMARAAGRPPPLYAPGPAGRYGGAGRGGTAPVGRAERGGSCRCVRPGRSGVTAGSAHGCRRCAGVFKGCLQTSPSSLSRLVPRKPRRANTSLRTVLTHV